MAFQTNKELRNTATRIGLEDGFGVIVTTSGNQSIEGELDLTSTDGYLRLNATRGTGRTYRIGASGSNAESFELYDETGSQRAALYTTGASGKWGLYTNGTERMVIDSSGEVTLKKPTTASAGTMMKIRGGNYGALEFAAGFSFSHSVIPNNYNRYWDFETGPATLTIRARATSDDSATIGTFNIHTSTGTEGLQINTSGKLTSTTTVTHADMAKFQGVTALTTNQVNRVLVANHTSTAMTHIGYSNSTNGDAGYLGLREGGSSFQYIWMNPSGILRHSIDSSHIGETSLGDAIGDQTSDERLKDNIEPISYGLAEVMSLEPIEYDMNGIHELGFGAQTTQPILPETVNDTQINIDDTGDTKLTMSYVRIIPVLTKAIQELSDKNDGLQEEINELRALITLKGK